MDIRALEEKDWPATWHILEPVFRAAETYAVDPAISEADAYSFWVKKPKVTFVATEQHGIAGTYFLKDNHDGPGNHICNAGYIVRADARGGGVGAKMCQHSLAEARRLGYAGMQYNIVAASNTGAIRLWKKMGFKVVGTLPAAFESATAGRVDAYVMYRELSDIELTP